MAIFRGVKIYAQGTSNSTVMHLNGRKYLQLSKTKSIAGA